VSTGLLPAIDFELRSLSDDPEPCEYWETDHPHGAPSHWYCKSRCPNHGLCLSFLCGDHRVSVLNEKCVCTECGEVITVISVDPL
jgi:hypothetical protein